MPTTNLSAAAESIRRSMAYWPPEFRVSKLLGYLDAHGAPLADILRAWPAEDREACGIDLVAERPSTRNAAGCPGVDS